MLKELIMSRHSIRKYRKKQVPLSDLETILEAGNYAPSAGGGLRSRIVAVRDESLVRTLGIMNLSKFDRSKLLGGFVSAEQPSVIDDPSMSDGFYGAPTVVCIFCMDGFLFREADAYCIAENILLQATELGIGSCIVSRGHETFDSEYGRQLMNSWGIPEDYSAVCFVTLGYTEGEQPKTKPRPDGRVLIVG